MSEPLILTFVCNWCSYGGADSAGGQKLDVPAGIRLVRVMCSGRVDPQMILKGFQSGADGVLVLGCHPGDCHYKNGNLTARKRMALLAQLLDQMGVHRDRFRLDWVSAAEGERFHRVVNEMRTAVAALGPLALDPDAVTEVQP